jgi:TRAP-type C4-dicarboxylate transport system permease large subunit
MIVLIIGGAFVFNYIVVSEQIPSLLGGLNLPPLLFVLLVNGLFLLFGCFLNATVMLLVLVPLPIPTLKALGIDLVHLGS